MIKTLKINHDAVAPSHPHKSHLARLLSRLIRWIRAAKGLPKVGPPGEKAASTNAATLWRIKTSEPGIVAAFWVVHKDASRDLAIALINLAQLREQLAAKPRKRGTGGTADPLRLTSRRAFRMELNRYLAEDDNLDLRGISHIFVSTWQSRTPNDHGHYKVCPIVAIPCDLQGASFAWAGRDQFAKNITEAMARQLLRLEVRRGETWESFVCRLDWVGWLADYARHQFGNHHILQPRKPEPK